MKVEGRRVVITGGASGIGLAIARQLADRGCQIVLADIDAASLKTCAEESKAFHTFVCDVTQPAELDAIDRQTQPDDGSDACNTGRLLGRLFDQIVV